MVEAIRPGKFILSERFGQLRSNEQALRWEGTFADYFEHIVVKRPDVARLSHRRIYDMVINSGVTPGKDGKPPHYEFFGKDLFGLDEPLSELMNYFNAAGKGLEVRKRILLFMGPPGGGKSTIVALFKRGLERYTKTDEGAVYAIKGCPMQEEPLHLIPESLRPDIKQELGVYIEGNLCPHCRQVVEDEFSGEVEEVPVERVFFSEQERRGIGTFSPSDPKSQNISELTGSINLARIGEVGVESDPRAYRFDGELNIANRGLMEFIEMLKCDEKFLYGLLTLSQEQNIKTGRFSMIYADEAVISHTNESEYVAFAGNRRLEALQDRIIVIKVAYNLRASEEERIYDKLLRESGVTKEIHIAPNALKVAAMFAVLSRLEEPKIAGMTLMKKLKLYDGQQFGDAADNDLKQMRDQAVREGMDGISPRFIVNRLSAAIAKDGSNKCVSPIEVLRSLRNGLDSQPGIKREDKEKMLGLMATVLGEYDQMAKQEVQRAFVYAYEDSARTLFKAYWDNVEAYCNKRKVIDPVTEEEVDPDEKLMSLIEDQAGVSEAARKAFREEFLIKISGSARRGGEITLDSVPRVKVGVEKKLFADIAEVVKDTTGTKNPSPQQLKRINGVKAHLVQDQGYCDHCAAELLKYVGALLNKE